MEAKNIIEFTNMVHDVFDYKLSTLKTKKFILSQFLYEYDVIFSNVVICQYMYAINVHNYIKFDNLQVKVGGQLTQKIAFLR